MDTKHNEVAIRGLQAQNKALEDEIERLETQLRYAAGQLSGYGENLKKHPEEVYDELKAYKT